jgi:hypothetical protein
MAADAPAGDAKKPDAPKGEAKKGEGRPQGGLTIPGVSAEDMKKLGEARKAAMESPEVKKAIEAAAAVREKAAKAEDKEAARAEMQKASQAVREATSAAILKSNPELADLLKKVDEAMKNRQGGKGGEGKGKGAPGKGGEGKGKGEKPADAPAAK